VLSSLKLEETDNSRGTSNLLHVIRECNLQTMAQQQHDLDQEAFSSATKLKNVELEDTSSDNKDALLQEYNQYDVKEGVESTWNKQ